MKLGRLITRRPKRATIRRGLISLVSGIVLTVTVAWTCRLYSESSLSGIVHGYDGILEHYRPEEWPTFESVRDYKGLGIKDRIASSPLYIGAASSPPEADPISHGGLVMAELYTGFPWVCMRSFEFWVGVHYEWDSSFEKINIGQPAFPFLDRGLAPPDWLPGAGWPRVLPLRPVWPGALYSVLFYSVLVFPMVCLVEYGWRRRHFRLDYRRRHGQCLKCKYPVGEFAVCPECGTPVESDE